MINPANANKRNGTFFNILFSPEIIMNGMLNTHSFHVKKYDWHSAILDRALRANSGNFIGWLGDMKPNGYLLAENAPPPFI